MTDNIYSFLLHICHIPAVGSLVEGSPGDNLKEWETTIELGICKVQEDCDIVEAHSCVDNMMIRDS